MISTCSLTNFSLIYEKNLCSVNKSERMLLFALLQKDTDKSEHNIQY